MVIVEELQLWPTMFCYVNVHYLFHHLASLALNSPLGKVVI